MILEATMRPRAQRLVRRAAAVPNDLRRRGLLSRSRLPRLMVATAFCEQLPHVATWAAPDQTPDSRRLTPRRSFGACIEYNRRWAPRSARNIT